jgi:D-alanyl-D-alanine carboxypeptidase
MSATFNGPRRTLQTAISRHRTPGLQYIVVNGSSTLFEAHEGLADIAAGRPMLAGTTMMAYSMSKTITAAAVLQLVEAGRLRLDDPVAQYVDWQPYGSGITIRQLLSHTSGIPNPIPLRWVHLAREHADFDELAALKSVAGRHKRLAFTPSTKYGYSNIGYWLCGAIVEQASGQPFTSYVTQHVLERLGIGPDEMAYTIADPSRHAAGYLEKYSWINLFKRLLIDRELIGGYAGSWLQIRDHYLNGPAFGGLVGSAAGFGRLLQDQLGKHSRLFGDATRATFCEQQRTPAGPIAMTLGWHIGSVGGVRFFYKEGGGGGFHSMMRLYPERGVGSVVMVNATSFNVRALLDTVDAAFLTARLGDT